MILTPTPPNIVTILRIVTIFGGGGVREWERG